MLKVRNSMDSIWQYFLQYFTNYPFYFLHMQFFHEEYPGFIFHLQLYLDFYLYLDGGLIAVLPIYFVNVIFAFSFIFPVEFSMSAILLSALFRNLSYFNKRAIWSRNNLSGAIEYLFIIAKIIQMRYSAYCLFLIYNT